MTRLILLLGIGCLLGLAKGYGSPGFYEGYQVFKVVPKTRQQVKDVQALLDIIPQIDFWRESKHVGQPAEFMVPPYSIDSMRDYLRSVGMNIDISVDNVERNIEKNRRDIEKRRELKAAAFDYETFNQYDDIMTEVDSMVSRCPTAHGFKCEVYSIGTTFEEREMKMLRIYKEDPNRPVYWVDSLIHAREWLSGAVHMKIIKHMLEDAATDATVLRLLEMGDWYFLPVHNPDGYQYSWDSARLWRKNRYNRTTILNPAGDECAGIDLNRNYMHRWRNSGSTADACSIVYGGPSPASELETQNVQNEVFRLQSRLKAFVTLHCAAKMILMPWGSVLDPGHDTTCEHLEPPEHNKVNNVAQAMATAIENTHGVHDWVAGTSCDILYPAGGTTQDFVTGFTGMLYSFTPELRDMDNEGNEYNSIFEPPPSEIHPAYVETWNGIVAMVDAIEDQPVETGRASMTTGSCGLLLFLIYLNKAL